MSRPSVVIVGGGISGLAAAWELSGGRAGPSDSTPRVQVIEASSRFGGGLRTMELGGRELDGGPDGVLARRPEAAQLIDELGLGDRVVPIAASGAWLYLRGHLDPIPVGSVLGVPTSARSLRPLRHLGRGARLAVWRDEHLPRHIALGDEPTIGEILRGKLGRTVAYQVAEPMIGGIQAGRIDDLSAREIFPALLTAARSGASLVRTLRRGTAPASGVASEPAFISLRPCLASLVTELERQLDARGVFLTAQSPVAALRRRTSGPYLWEVDATQATVPASTVILTTPPRITAELVGHRDPALAALKTVDSASCAMVNYSVGEDSIRLPATGTGILIPLGTPCAAGDSMIVTALTFLDRKWPHLAAAGTTLIRAHVGRIDDHRAVSLSDDDLARRVRVEVGEILGTFPSAGLAHVERFPEALPQYRPGHGSLIQAARVAAAQDALHLAGNAYDGVGIPASIGSGRREAVSVLSDLGA